jgi:YidC/Oxa1 family membrane protein insertase
LLNAIELRGAPFVFWIHDLSVRDPYFITPILMGASMYVQQKIMPASIDPKQAKLMAFLPVIFTVMFLNFPSGLVIYWLFNNILTVAQQIFIDAKRLKVSEQKKAG